MIQPQVISIHWHRAIYREVGEITRSNNSLPPSHFFTFVSDTYVHSQAIAVRRQTDTDPRVISLGTLLSEMATDSTRLTRRFYVSLYDEHIRELADPDFDRLAGAGADHVPRAPLETVMRTLCARSEPIEAFVNRHIAHTDRRPLPALPTHNDLNVAIDAVGDAFNECSRILTASSWAQLDPVPQYDWTAIFRVPWLPPGR